MSAQPGSIERCSRLLDASAAPRRSSASRSSTAYRWTLGVFVPEGTCKYHPSCSQYAIDALRKHGLVKGSFKAGWRLLRCNPWSKGGVDHA